MMPPVCLGEKAVLRGRAKQKLKGKVKGKANPVRGLGVPELLHRVRRQYCGILLTCLELIPIPKVVPRLVSFPFQG